MAKGDPTMYKGYLGGHDWKTHTDQGALQYLINQYSIRSMLDVGCGPGGQVALAKSLGVRAEGVDGDTRCVKEAVGYFIHENDYTKSEFHPPEDVDLIWSTEFVEHVKEEYVDNFLATFKHARVVFLTFAPPGTAGNHHVNCQSAEYWIEKMEAIGFRHNLPQTLAVREESTMERDFVRNNGLLFERV